MIDTEPRRRLAAALGAAAILALALTGCAGTPTTPDSGTADAPIAEAETQTEADTSSDEVVVIGGELPSGTVALLAETYAKGRDPRPTVEFLDAMTVRFEFPSALGESDLIGNCQIAWGSLEAEGVQIFIVDPSTETDCNALITG
ncbi:hypothetical protein PYV02_06970 [Leifsonia sp. H3M29-4]|uniref:hypothetical protein n=1 Tax=Salinibacterium metalliresistens TaxID=3031321 RepID=UPI0023DBC0B5|nr:hypothetical protein [Salinibacterium metalliresistens]MDF1478826.1 hypothetical protein [Salinibacterium metalliresistens]